MANYLDQLNNECHAVVTYLSSDPGLWRTAVAELDRILRLAENGDAVAVDHEFRRLLEDWPVTERLVTEDRARGPERRIPSLLQLVETIGAVRNALITERNVTDDDVACHLLTDSDEKTSAVKPPTSRLNRIHRSQEGRS